tara:strand:+ start:1096 stop:2124 length:1029 start_codon:yes stop_codon:yes gene_type:complete
MTILITGASGFIGFHLALRLIKDRELIVGFDNFNDYYDPKLKEARYKILDQTAKNNNVDFEMIRNNLEDYKAVEEAFKKFKPKVVIHLAAQAGVRYSLINPSSYIQSNLVGFGNILECCRKHQINNLIYASSSSVYGGNTNMPFSEKQSVDHPISLYAASKKANELMAHSYSHLYNIPSIGLRFFTVYGPWGRPDMALFLFTKSILEGKTIKIFGEGEMYRDFTYIEDIIESMMILIKKPAIPDKNFDPSYPDPSSSFAPHKIFNIGNSNPVKLLDFVNNIEICLNRKAKKEFLPIQPGEVISTFSDTSSLESWTNFRPQTPVSIGVKNFIDWYKDFYKIDS